MNNNDSEKPTAGVARGVPRAEGLLSYRRTSLFTHRVAIWQGRVTYWSAPVMAAHFLEGVGCKPLRYSLMIVIVARRNLIKRPRNVSELFRIPGPPEALNATLSMVDICRNQLTSIPFTTAPVLTRLF